MGMTKITLTVDIVSDGTYSPERIAEFIADHLDLHDSDHYEVRGVETAFHYEGAE